MSVGESGSDFHPLPRRQVLSQGRPCDAPGLRGPGLHRRACVTEGQATGSTEMHQPKWMLDVTALTLLSHNRTKPGKAARWPPREGTATLLSRARSPREGVVQCHVKTAEPRQSPETGDLGRRALQKDRGQLRERLPDGQRRRWMVPDALTGGRAVSLRGPCSRMHYTRTANRWHGTHSLQNNTTFVDVYFHLKKHIRALI